MTTSVDLVIPRPPSAPARTPFRALRLMVTDRPYELVHEDRLRMSLYDLREGRLVPATESIAPDVRRIVVIDSEGARAVLFGHSLAHDSDRTVAGALAAVQRKFAPTTGIIRRERSS